MAAINTHQFRCAGDVAVAFGQFAQDVFAFVGFRGFAVGIEIVARRGRRFGAEDRQVVGDDFVACVHDDHALDRVAKLADVAGPGVILHPFDCRGFEIFRRFAVGQRELAVEMLDQRGHIFQSFAQRRNLKRNDVQAVEQVGAKRAAFNFGFEPFVGRGDHARVNCHGCFRTDRLESLFFQRAQNFRLSLQTHIADFVQKDRRAVRSLEFSAPGLSRAGESAFDVTEQFGFDQFFGNGGAVDFDERARGAQAVRV
ncbi:MAG: hypothetical protein JMDDDDMK_05057 [Acidobacteria bacterium]|nr:hypothetical protein [Acidobacteriota bacterium]